VSRRVTPCSDRRHGRARRAGWLAHCLAPQGCFFRYDRNSAKKKSVDGDAAPVEMRRMKKAYTKANAVKRQPLAAITAQVTSGPVVD